MKAYETPKEGRGLAEWAQMNDTEFLFRYLADANEEELAEFLNIVPEFMEE